MALTKLSRVKTILGIGADDATKDAQIAEIIERISAQIKTKIQRDIEYAAYTEYHDGTGDCGELVLAQYPVDSAATFTIYDDPDRAYGSNTLVDSSDYSVDHESGIVKLDGALTFSRGKRNVKVSYSAGYKTIPQDLEQAAINLVAAEFLMSQGTLNVSTSRDSASRIDDLRKQAAATLNLYARMVIA